MSWQDLEKMTDEILIGNNPGLRKALRDALDSGASPAVIRKRYGLDCQRTSLTACAVEAIVAEWEKEVDAIAAELERVKKGGKSS